MRSKFILLMNVLLISAACQQDRYDIQEPQRNSEIHAEVEPFEEITKTSVNSANTIIWSKGDYIAAFLGSTKAARYQVTDACAGTPNGDFVEAPVGGGGLSSGNELTTNALVYPYESDLIFSNHTVSGDNVLSFKIERVTIPSIQRYQHASFADDSFIMVAVTKNEDDYDFKFKNGNGALKLQLKGNFSVKSIELKGNKNEPLSGDATVIVSATDVPEIIMSEDANKTITLDCGEGVQLNEQEATIFMITLPPTKFESGFTLNITDTDGNIKVLSTAKQNPVNRSRILRMPEATLNMDVLELPDGTPSSYDIPSKGGTIEIPLTTNLDYNVVIPEAAEEWITLVETKALRNETIMISIAENKTEEARSAEIIITDTNHTTIFQTITIKQDKGEVALPTSPDEFALVDLGLSVKWANYNLGSNSPYEVGQATDWGHEEGKDASCPAEMNIAGSGYDLVRSELGGDWRLPTAFDFMELEQKCTWTHTIINDISGNLVTGPNGNSIFLPDVEYWTGTAREHSTTNYDYIYGIKWLPENSTINTGTYNRPVQGDVRVYPDVTYSINNITNNTAIVEVSINDSEFEDIDLELHLRVSRDGSFLLKYSSYINNKFIFNVENLGSGCDYRVKATYNILGHEITDNNNAQIQTSEAKDGDGLEADPIDVGLSVKWASWNLGASCENDLGLKLAWGGISVNDDTYSNFNENISGTALDPATMIWGPEWRLPTMSEWNELWNNHYSTSYVNADVGMMLKDRIFLPNGNMGITSYMSGSYGNGLYFLVYDYCWTGSISSEKTYVRPVYDPLPQLSKILIYDQESTSVTLKSNVVRIGGGEISEIGFVYSTKQNPTLETASHVKVNNTSYEEFETSIVDLSPKTTYFAKAYAKNSYGISYGEELSFTTADEINNGEPDDPSISFKSPEVESAFVAAFDQNADNKLSYSEAASVINLSVVTFPKSVEVSFDEFQYFTSVTIIPKDYFKGSKLTSIVFPNSLREIDQYAFRGCADLISISLPENIKLCYQAFYGCSALTELTIPAGIDWTTDVFRYCTGLQTVTISVGVESIPACAFSYCESLSSITIPSTVTKLMEYAFDGCKALTSVTMPDSVTEMGMGIFYGCEKLKTVKLSANITKLLDRTFYRCTSLESIEIPSKVTEIGYEVFYDCTALNTVFVKNTTPPTVSSDLFYHCNSLSTIYVPSSAFSVYQSRNNWANFKDKMVGITF